MATRIERQASTSRASGARIWPRTADWYRTVLTAAYGLPGAAVHGVLMGRRVRHGASQLDLEPTLRTFSRRLWARTGAKLEVVGLEHLDGAPPSVVACKHQSFLDAIALMGHLPVPLRFAATGPLFDSRIWGKAMRALGHIPIPANGHRSQGLLKAAPKLFAAGVSLGIFPEGERSAELLPLKPGAARVALKYGVPIFPVALAGFHEILPRGHSVIRANETAVVLVGPRLDPGDFKDDVAMTVRLAEVMRQLQGEAEARRAYAIHQKASAAERRSTRPGLARG